MAYTVSRKNSVFGNERVAICEVSADAASGTVPTGMSAIDAAMISPKSMASSAIKVSTSGGTVTISNAANGDNFFLMVYGR